MHLNKNFYKALIEKVFHPIHHKCPGKTEYQELEKEYKELKKEHNHGNIHTDVNVAKQFNATNSHSVIHIFYHNHHLEHAAAEIQYKKIEAAAEKKHHEFAIKGLTCLHYHLHHVFALPTAKVESAKATL